MQVTIILELSWMESKFMLLQTKYGSVLTEMSLQGDPSWELNCVLMDIAILCYNAHTYACHISSIGGYDDSKRFQLILPHVSHVVVEPILSVSEGTEQNKTYKYPSMYTSILTHST